MFNIERYKAIIQEIINEIKIRFIIFYYLICKTNKLKNKTNIFLLHFGFYFAFSKKNQE